jgi:hypothetical protein
MKSKVKVWKYVIGLSLFFNHAHAQQTKGSNQKQGTVQNESSIVANATDGKVNSSCRVILKTQKGGCIVFFENNTFSGKETAKSMENPFVILKAYDKNDLIQDKHSKPEKLKDVTAKLKFNDSWYSPLKLTLKNGQYSFPIDVKNGKCLLELYWSWEETVRNGETKYAGGVYLLDINNGICTNMTLFEGGI